MATLSIVFLDFWISGPNQQNNTVGVRIDCQVSLLTKTMQPEEIKRQLRHEMLFSISFVCPFADPLPSQMKCR